MFDAIPAGGGEGAIFFTAPGECGRPSLVEANRLAEKVRASLARIDRQMSKLPSQAERLRTLATDLNVNGAFSGDPKIQSAMFRIADQYERMACSAEMSYEQYLRRRRRENPYQQFAAAADQASALAPASARTRASSAASSLARPE